MNHPGAASGGVLTLFAGIMRWRSAAAGRRDVHVVLSLFLSAAMVHVIFFSCKQQATITLEKGISFLCDLKKPITIRHRVAPSPADCCWILSSEYPDDMEMFSTNPTLCSSSEHATIKNHSTILE